MPNRKLKQENKKERGHLGNKNSGGTGTSRSFRRLSEFCWAENSIAYSAKRDVILIHKRLKKPLIHLKAIKMLNRRLKQKITQNGAIFEIENSGEIGTGRFLQGWVSPAGNI